MLLILIPWFYPTNVFVGGEADDTCNNLLMFACMIFWSTDAFFLLLNTGNCILCNCKQQGMRCEHSLSNEKGITQVMACYSNVCFIESINYTMGQMYVSVAATKTVLIKTFIILPHMKKSTCQWLYIVCSPSLLYLNIECQTSSAFYSLGQLDSSCIVAPLLHKLFSLQPNPILT